MLRSTLCNTTGVPLLFLLSTDIKQLLDEVLVICGIIKVELVIYKRGRRIELGTIKNGSSWQSKRDSEPPNCNLRALTARPHCLL